MKLCIAGSRCFTGEEGLQYIREGLRYALTEWGISMSAITTIVSGLAPGIDTVAAQRAKVLGILVLPMPADWDNLDAPGAVIRQRRDGTLYNARAGYDRNLEMAVVSDYILVVWDGRSGGSWNMFETCTGLKKPVYLHIPFGYSPRE